MCIVNKWEGSEPRYWEGSHATRKAVGRQKGQVACRRPVVNEMEAGIKVTDKGIQ